MLGHEHSELFVLTKMRILEAHVAIDSMCLLQFFKNVLSERDFETAKQWLLYRRAPVNFINLHFFTPQQAILAFESNLKDNVVQLDEHVHASEILDIVLHIDDHLGFYIFRPQELDNQG